MKRTKRTAIIEQVKNGSGSPSELARLIKVSPQRADQLLHPEKHKARALVNRNHKPDCCQICGRATKDLEAHHPDYNNPTLIIWACVPCHNLLG